MKRWIAFLLVMVLLFACFPQPMYAAGAGDAMDSVGYYLEPSRVETINRLFADRHSLLRDISHNREAILRIDYQLRDLGVEEVEFSELARKVRGDSPAPRAGVAATTNDTKWTSFRASYVYRGVLYEIQDVRGVPNLDWRTEGEMFSASEYP